MSLSREFKTAIIQQLLDESKQLFLDQSKDAPFTAFMLRSLRYSLTEETQALIPRKWCVRIPFDSAGKPLFAAHKIQPLLSLALYCKTDQIVQEEKQHCLIELVQAAYRICGISTLQVYINGAEYQVVWCPLDDSWSINCLNATVSR